MYISPKTRTHLLSSFGHHLAILRHDSGLSQEEAGLLLGIPHSNIARYELGQGNPTLLTLVKFARVYKVSMEEVVRGTRTD